MWRFSERHQDKKRAPYLDKLTGEISKNLNFSGNRTQGKKEKGENRVTISNEQLESIPVAP